MSTDASTASRARDEAGFDRDARGAAAVRVLHAHLAATWPDLARLRVLGLGAAAAYLAPWREKAATCIAAGLGENPAAGADAVFAEPALPLPDLSVDRILLVHALEHAADARRLLRECWRVLRDDGRILAVVPNRLGLWAHAEQTPFGEGRPFTHRQLAGLLGGAMFAVERREHALFVPPVPFAPVLRAAPLLERLGRRVAPGLGGLLVAEAVKDTYAAIPLHAVARRRLLPAPQLGLLREAA